MISLFSITVYWSDWYSLLINLMWFEELGNRMKSWHWALCTVYKHCKGFDDASGLAIWRILQKNNTCPYGLPVPMLVILLYSTLHLASFPGLPRFDLPFVFTIIHGIGRLTKIECGRPGSIYHVNDVRWMRGGHRGGGQLPKQRTGPFFRALYRVIGLQTLAWWKLLVLTSKKLTF